MAELLRHCIHEETNRRMERMATQTVANVHWKQWKKPKTKYRNLLKLGISEKYAWMTAKSRRGYWFTAGTSSVERAISNEKLARAGYYDLSEAYERIRSACIGCAVYRMVRTVR